MYKLALPSWQMSGTEFFIAFNGSEAIILGSIAPTNEKIIIRVINIYSSANVNSGTKDKPMVLPTDACMASGPKIPAKPNSMPTIESDSTTPSSPALRYNYLVTI